MFPLKIFSAFLFVFINNNTYANETPTIEEQKHLCEASGKTWNNWCNPTIILDADLAQNITITECEPISGLSCRLTLLPMAKFPTKIFVQSRDSNGPAIGKEWPLIYPDLPKEGWTSGIATFLNGRTDTAQLFLRGEWN